MLKNPEDIARRLRELRQEHPEIRARALAERAGVSEQAVSQWYTTGKISWAGMAAILELYQVDTNLQPLVDGVRDAPGKYHLVDQELAAKIRELPPAVQESLAALIDTLLEQRGDE